MDYAQLILLFFAVGLIAFLYSSVGHAGASGYIAVMTLWGLALEVIRPTAAGAQHSGHLHRHVPILARRTFCLEIILAICAALNSGGSVFRWLSPTIRLVFENAYRLGTALFSCAPDPSAERSAKS